MARGHRKTGELHCVAYLGGREGEDAAWLAMAIARLGGSEEVWGLSEQCRLESERIWMY